MMVLKNELSIKEFLDIIRIIFPYYIILERIFITFFYYFISKLFWGECFCFLGILFFSKQRFFAFLNQIPPAIAQEFNSDV